MDNVTSQHAVMQLTFRPEIGRVSHQSRMQFSENDCGCIAILAPGHSRGAGLKQVLLRMFLHRCLAKCCSTRLCIATTLIHVLPRRVPLPALTLLRPALWSACRASANMLTRWAIAHPVAAIAHPVTRIFAILPTQWKTHKNA